MFRALRDYLELRHVTPDARTLLRVRRTHRAGETIHVRVRHGTVDRAIDLRGGTQDVSVFFEIFARDAYRLAMLPPRLGTVIDLGGNVGLFALRAAGMSERVLSFEPMPENFERLKTNTGGLASVETHNRAVGATDGTLTLYAAATARGTGRFSAQPQKEIHDAGAKFDVECVSLDTLFARHAIGTCDLLKIDIEGSEYDVLLNASDETLATIRRIHGEYHPSNADAGALPKLKARLDAAGFITRWESQRSDERYGMFFAWR